MHTTMFFFPTVVKFFLCQSQRPFTTFFSYPIETNANNIIHSTLFVVLFFSYKFDQTIENKVTRARSRLPVHHKWNHNNHSSEVECHSSSLISLKQQQQQKQRVMRPVTLVLFSFFALEKNNET